MNKRLPNRNPEGLSNRGSNNEEVSEQESSRPSKIGAARVTNQVNDMSRPQA